MAIVQISRITNRKGLAENLPQLAGAEFGWCIDTRQLFIGNGTLQDGAPVIGNTEILTEFSDITSLSKYIYSDAVVGYSAQTGPTSGDPVIRTVQAKLDDFADVRDFGAQGDGVTDDTAAINRALYQLYCRETNTEIRRSLFFPAGTYLVSDTIVIPTWAKLVGEGADCVTILRNTIGYVAVFGDSLQQTGGSIGTNGATPPRNIEISSMTFQNSTVSDIFLVEQATQCYFDSVNFRGILTTTDILNNQATDNIAGVRFSSTLASVCNQLTFDKCRFSSLTYGINTDEQIQSVTVSNSAFETLYQGIVLGTGVPVNGGPTGFRAVHNMFDTIYAQGIVYDQVNLNCSAYNVFYDVGNNYTLNPETPCVTFVYDNNVSISDMFQRTDFQDESYPRVYIQGSTGTTGTQIQLGRYARLSGRTFTMADNVSNQPIFTLNSDNIKAFRVDYTLERNLAIRHGSMIVVAKDVGDSSQTYKYTEDYTEDDPTGITLAATQSGNAISMIYSSTSTGSSATLTYSIAHLA